MFVYVVNGLESWSCDTESQVFSMLGKVDIPTEGNHIPVTEVYEYFAENGDLYNIPHEEFVEAICLSFEEDDYDIFTLKNWERVKEKKNGNG